MPKRPLSERRKINSALNAGALSKLSCVQSVKLPA